MVIDPTFRITDRYLSYQILQKSWKKIIYSGLYKFISKINILSNKQFGFVKGRGRKDALNNITNILYNNLDKNKPIIGTFLDLAKAFDTVNILLQKLERYGIRGNILQLMKSYLLDRQQKVRLQNESSDYGKITTGVPPGTVLGPLFFILYINDLLRDMPKDNILSDADDTVLIVSEDSWSAAQDNMNILLNNVADWLALNKLSLNIQKTMYITFGNYSKSVPQTLNIEIQNQKIRRVKVCKYLGIHLTII